MGRKSPSVYPANPKKMIVCPENLPEKKKKKMYT